MIYKLYNANVYQTIINAAMTIDADPAISFVFAPDNTDYINFKNEILNDQAQLQDADGNLMTPEAAKEFVKGLP